MATARPLERIVFAGAHATVGEWRCDRGRADFRDTGPIEHHLVAFARTSVRIRHEGGRPFVADAAVFSVYNRGQRYTREPVHPRGDHCDWWGVDADTARAIAREVDPHAAHESDRPFRFDCGPADAALYLDQRALLERMRAGEVDALEAEEAAMAIIARALVAARGGPLHARAARPAHRELAQASVAFVGARLAETLTLSTIARALGVTPFTVPLSRSDKPVKMRFEKPGYDPKTIEVPIAASLEIEVSLAKQREPVAAKSPAPIRKKPVAKPAAPKTETEPKKPKAPATLQREGTIDPFAK